MFIFNCKRNKITIHLVVVFLSFLSLNGWGQEKEVITIESGLCFIDLIAPQKPFTQQITEANWEGIYQGVPLYLAISKNINPSFSAIVRFETAQIDSSKYNNQPFTSEIEKKLSKPTIWNIYTGLRYNLANGYILPEESWFNMHFEGGLGNTFLNNRSYFSQYTGFGFEFNSSAIGVFTNAGYNYMTEWEDYFSFELGIKVKIKTGKKKSPQITEIEREISDNKKNQELSESGQSQKNNNEIEFEPYLNNSIGSYNTTQGVNDNDIPTVSEEITSPITDPLPQPGSMSPGVSNQRPVKTGPSIERPDILDPPKPFQRIQSPKSVPLQRKNTSNKYHYYFDTDSYELPDIYYQELQDIAQQLKEIKNLYVRIYGHTDNLYSRDYNLQLSEDRAFEIQTALLNMGVDPEKIKTVRGYGEDKPIAPNDTEVNRMLNRRVEVELFNI